MAQLSLTTADEVLQEDYQDDVRDFLNQNVFILTQTDVNTSRVSGRRAHHAVHTRRSRGVGSRAENGTLPTAHSQGYKNLLIPIRYTYGRIELSGPVIAAMGTNKAAFVDALDSEMTGIRDDVQRDRSRQSWGLGNGVIAQCGVTSAANLIVLDSGTTETELDQLFNDGGMVVDIGTVANPTLRATARNVTAVDYDAKTITIDGATITTAATDFCFRSGGGGASDGSGDPNDGQIEITGLQAIVDDDTDLHALAVSANESWKSHVFHNSGANRPVTEQLVNKAIHTTERKSGKHVNLLVGTDGVSRSVANLLEALRRNVDNVDLKAGYSGIGWTTAAEGMGKRTQTTLCWDRDAPGNSLYGIATDGLVRYQMQDYEWMKRDGSVFSRKLNADAYEATLTIYDELAAKQRNCHFRIDDITEAG